MRRKTGFRKGAGFFTLMISLILSLIPMRYVQAADRLQDVGDKLVIVIDPGHGGENQGTIENNHEEKSMTIVTALAMYEELSLYDDVEVHLTRTGDVEKDIKLADRAAFAASVDADFLFSIHYNASLNHELYGAEVWVSAFEPFNGYGYQFGYEILSDLHDIGLLTRGVKTRLGDSGNNYYGIIRESEALGIPAVIIEHCHVDEARDEGFCDSIEKLQEFGRMDATAVARYFGLKSSVLGVDYSGYQLVDSSATEPVPFTVRDETEPDVCQIDPAEVDYETGLLSLTVTAADYDSTLLYYSYSIDGGKSFSQREPWPESNTLIGSYPDTFILNLTIPTDTKPTVILRAYNMYDLYTDSNSYISPERYHYPEPEEILEAVGPAQAGDDAGADTGEDAVGADSAGEPSGQRGGQRVSFVTFLVICLVAVFILFILLLVSQGISAIQRGKRMRQRRKELGRNSDQLR